MAFINKPQLIAYPDRIAYPDSNLKGLHNLLTGPLKGVFSGVHILPPFEHSGLDAGFDVTDHTKISPEHGSWEDINKFGKSGAEVMLDFIVNHISPDSPQFQDFIHKGKDSKYFDLFFTEEKLERMGFTEEDFKKVFSPRDKDTPMIRLKLDNGKQIRLWATFTEKQIDIDLFSAPGEKYLDQVLKVLSENGVTMIRIDAGGYVVKKAGTSCFMIPETFKFFDDFAEKSKKYGIDTLIEVHSPYKEQIRIASKVDMVYDFALPPLILHAIEYKTGEYLVKWLQKSPRNAVTVLGTHDGIGVLDAVGLVPDEELDGLVEKIHKNSKGDSRKATGEAANNLDLYQVNCTYFDALGADEEKMLLARALQLFCPGIPQIYYNDLFLAKNDMGLLSQTREGRDINRHYYTKEEVDGALKSKVVKEQLQLIKMRHSDVFDGSFSLKHSKDYRKLKLGWESGKGEKKLVVDFDKLEFTIEE